jgi:hypothetical protein
MHLLERHCTLNQTFVKIKGEKNVLHDLDLNDIFKTPNNWLCDLMITISNMKEHAALTIASLDEYCAVVTTPQGLRILFESPYIPTFTIIEALEEAGWSDIKTAKCIQNWIMNNDVSQSIEG